MFWIIFFSLAAGSILAIHFLIKEEKAKNKRFLEQSELLGQLEDKIQMKNMEIQTLNHKLKNGLDAQSEEFNKKIKESETKLIQVQNSFIKENSEKLMLEKQLQEYKIKIEKLVKDLALVTEMYEGLKIQYNDLERDMEKTQELNGKIQLNKN